MPGTRSRSPEFEPSPSQAHTGCSMCPWIDPQPVSLIPNPANRNQPIIDPKSFTDFNLHRDSAHYGQATPRFVVLTAAQVNGLINLYEAAS